MANTTPNKETIRRVCILHGGSYCYLHVDTGDEYVAVLSNINNEKLMTFHEELEAWCGMKFKLFNENSREFEIMKITKYGEKILPIMMT